VGGGGGGQLHAAPAQGAGNGAGADVEVVVWAEGQVLGAARAQGHAPDSAIGSQAQHKAIAAGGVGNGLRAQRERPYRRTQGVNS
nr:hypothetical protein [Tanacetum cinerariifolium]